MVWINMSVGYRTAWMDVRGNLEACGDVLRKVECMNSNDEDELIIPESEPAPPV